jgi:competence protein ComEC
MDCSLGGGTLQILQGGSAEAADDSVNNASLCTLFTAGDFRFLDTGDAEEAAEQQLLDTYGTSLHTTLFKAGHHGSYTSNSLAFLQAAAPQAVAVSCGLNNDYGHPHRAALQNFAAVGAEAYRTDLQGSLTFIWQNDTLTVETTADSAELAA